MKLRRPTDFLILDALDKHGRNVATNLQYHTGKSRKNINTRLPVLADYDLVEKIGPAERSGLYELTPLGKAALGHREQYDDVDDFQALISSSAVDTPSPSVQSQQAVARGNTDGAID